MPVLPPGSGLTRKIIATAVYRKSDDDAESLAQTELYKQENADPSGRFKPGHYRVLVRTAFPTISLQDIGGRIERLPEGSVEEYPPGPEVPLRPPVGEFTKRFSAATDESGADLLFSTARRIRDYLTFTTARVVPLVALMGGKDRVGKAILYPIKFSSEGERSIPPPGLHRTEGGLQRWYDYMASCYVVVRRLLDELAPESPISRAVRLTGEAIWTPDHEERFFYGWRALEVIANDDLRSVRAGVEGGNLDPARPYIEPRLKAWIARERIALDTASMIGVSVRARLPDADLARIPRYLDLRNAIAHGDVTPEQHRDIVNEANGIVGMARACSVKDLSGRIDIPVEPTAPT